MGRRRLVPLFDDSEVTQMTIALLSARPCRAHARAGLNVCSECHVVSCFDCGVMLCMCAVGADEDDEVED